MKLLHDWADRTAADVFKDFSGTRWDAYREEDSTPVEEQPQFAGFEIIFGSYSYESWSGDAFVLCRKDGQLYEVNGGHCSCYGLEGQWEPEETTLEAVLHRMNEGNLGGQGDCSGNVFADELRAVIAELQAADPNLPSTP